MGNRRNRNRRRGQGLLPSLGSSLTGLGRVALGSLVVLLVAGLSWGAQRAWHAWGGSGSQRLPNVSAPPPPAKLSTRWLEDPPLSRERFEEARSSASEIDPSAGPRLVEWRIAQARSGAGTGSVSPQRDRFRIEYSLDERLTESVFEILRRGPGWKRCAGRGNAEGVATGELGA